MAIYAFFSAALLSLSSLDGRTTCQPLLLINDNDGGTYSNYLSPVPEH